MRRSEKEVCKYFIKTIIPLDFTRWKVGGKINQNQSAYMYLNTAAPAVQPIVTSLSKNDHCFQYYLTQRIHQYRPYITIVQFSIKYD